MADQSIDKQVAVLKEAVAVYAVDSAKGEPNTAANVSPATVDLRVELQNFFREAEEEVFSDGVESAFARRLLALLNAHGTAAMNQVILLAEEEAIAPEVLAEALRWFGHMGDGVAAVHRRWLLEHALQHPSIQVRDGAILGLSFLEDPRVVPALEAALSREPHDTLRADIQQVIADLQEMLP